MFDDDAQIKALQRELMALADKVEQQSLEAPQDDATKAASAFIRAGAELLGKTNAA